MKKFGKRRHLVKAVSWRIVGTIDTILLSWILSGNLSVGIKVGGFELLTKIALYYLHDRAWYVFVRSEKLKSTVRHAIKAITWRILGTIDTMLLGFFVSGNAELGIKIGAFELITKSVIYFIHERAWYHSDFGLIRETNENLSMELTEKLGSEHEKSDTLIDQKKNEQYKMEASSF